MPHRKPKPRFITPLSLALTEYLNAHPMSQLDLAEYLNIGERTLRRYKNGEDVLTDIKELKRIAELLEIEPEKFGVATSLSLPLTPDEIDTSIDHAWRLINAQRCYEANILADKLIRDINNLIQTEDATLLRKLAHARHVTGFIKSHITRADETAIPFSHYQEMERIARILGDQTLINVAFTYEGDMLQRGGKIEESIQYLEAARDTTPLADVSARGNGIQLLGRAYFRAGRLADFEQAIKEAEALAHDPSMDDSANSARQQYSAGTVYEEYGRSLGLLRQLKEALAYLDKAQEAFLPVANHNREVLMKTARAMVLVHGGEIQQGIEIAVESISLCRQQGNVRLLDRIYAVQQYLDNLARKIGSTGNTLRDALTGPIEY